MTGAGVTISARPRGGSFHHQDLHISFAAQHVDSHVVFVAHQQQFGVYTGEIIAFTDDDVQVRPDWLSALGARFARQPHVSVVTGLVIPLELETQAQIFFEQSGSGQDRGYAPLTFERAGRFQVRRRDQQGDTDEVRSLYLTGEFGFGANMAFRTAVLQASGGFDEALGVGTPTRGGEDLAGPLNGQVAESVWKGKGNKKTPLNFLQAGRTAGPEQRRGRRWFRY